MAPLVIAPQSPLATNPWAIGAVSNDSLTGVGLYIAGIWGCTEEPLNKWPVTDSFWGGIPITNDCRCSDQGSPHSTANFRSDHPGGGQFLLSDSSVQFIVNEIDFTLYRAMSTIAGGEIADPAQP
jgi:hypothetical protein